MLLCTLALQKILWLHLRGRVGIRVPHSSKDKCSQIPHFRGSGRNRQCIPQVLHVYVVSEGSAESVSPRVIQGLLTFVTLYDFKMQHFMVSALACFFKTREIKNCIKFTNLRQSSGVCHQSSQNTSFE